MAVAGKCLSGPPFTTYVNALRRALAQRIDPFSVDVLHLQHLAFGGTPALIRALPAHPRIALVHGTDLLFAEAHRDRLRVLQETARLADAIVVPTGAMADHLLQLVPTTDRRKLTKIPWGIPDHLLTAPPARPARRPTGHLRLLYAGRLTPEKGIEALLRAMPVAQAVELSTRHPATSSRA
ncbi:hypothetical protein GCM10023084_68890 [Streptomyces lacrimifluminis]|uniref:Glycosyltransferase subfamily 4-like N-terminal domain-containing protein n=1 Tax=Streptomyces lacrimifluminis TaxID=1500077 RepID=A0A917P444_9ACTN|nr:hypothetical protein GCM10012282_67490 [Streptomyces lacrimifluminis]